MHLTLDCAGADDAVGARRRVYDLCPLLLDCVSTGESVEVADADRFAPRDWRQTALDYVDERFAQRADLEQLQRKARTILEEVENVIASR